MENSLQVIPFAEIKQMAVAVASSNLFGMKTPEQALTLMLLAQAEGMHPITAARDYDIIQGRPSKKSEAMLRDFMKAGGKVEWHSLTNEKADATFSHPIGGVVRIDWDMPRAKAAALGGKDMWSKYPRQMLRARVVSEGVRSVFPLATSGMYVPEENQDLPPKPPIVHVEQPKNAPHPQFEDDLPIDSAPQNLQSAALPTSSAASKEKIVLGGRPEKKTEPEASSNEEWELSESKRKALYSIATQFNWNDIQIHEYIAHMWNLGSIKKLSADQYRSLLETMKTVEYRKAIIQNFQKE